MVLNDFIKKFADQFEDIDTSGFSKETKFKDIEGWSSFMVLSIIAMVDDAYKVKLSGNEIRNSETIEDLFKIISSKI